MKKVKMLYEKRTKVYQRLENTQMKAANKISNLRLLVFTSGTILSGVLYYLKLYFMLAAVLITCITIFVYLVVKHRRIIENKKYTEALKEINSQSLSRIQGEWNSFEDTGNDFRDESHPYINDLDIFGRGSLFQWINTSSTCTGRQKLAQVLKDSPLDTEEIAKRQEAIKELSQKLCWRQNFVAEGSVIKSRLTSLEDLYQWSGRINQFYRNRKVIILIRSLPVITALLGLINITTGFVPWYVPAGGLALQFLMLKYKIREREYEFATAEKYKNTLIIYKNLLRAFENKNLQSEYLVELKQRLKNSKGDTASKQINMLVKLWESISNRYNAFHIFFNILTLWDYQCLVRLEQWKNQSGREVKLWLDTIGEAEALCSLAIIGHDNPEWVYPVISADKDLQIKATSMGHPLLGEKRVCNDLEIVNPNGILLITGSNMSGKSTFLRTLGINLILAYAGAPVCAAEVKCSVMKIYTCMRISDNLEQNISSFYAELMRIKIILNASVEEKQILFLLDEIFKGTNSRDRHTGAKVLIRELSSRGAIGMVSTHDLELSDLEKESGGRIKNYHFREYYRENKIFFDYKLRPGVSTTQNAIYLMQMAGINIDK